MDVKSLYTDDEICDLIRSDKWYDRCMGIDMAKDRPDVDFSLIHKALLYDTDPNVRISAAEVLKYRPHDVSFELLKSLIFNIETHTEIVRQAAICLIVKCEELTT